MRSVEHLIEQHHLAQESKNLLRWRLIFEEYQQDFLFNELELSKDSFLDVGTGDGAFVHYLRTEKGNRHVNGIDKDAAQESDYLSSGDILNIPYADHLFDQTISRNVMHAVMLQSDGDVRKAIQELVRVTRNGGKVSYSTHNPKIILERIRDSNELSSEQKESITKRFENNLDTESATLKELESLGHAITTIMRNKRKVVLIRLREVQ